MSSISHSDLAYVLVITLNVLVIILNRFHGPWQWGGGYYASWLYESATWEMWVCESGNASQKVRVCELRRGLTKKCQFLTCNLQLADLWLATRSLVTCNLHNSHTRTFSDLSHCDIQPHLEVLMLCHLVRKYVPSKRRRRRSLKEKLFVDERLQHDSAEHCPNEVSIPIRSWVF